MCHGKMENFADVATLEGVWFSEQSVSSCVQCLCGWLLLSTCLVSSIITSPHYYHLLSLQCVIVYFCFCFFWLYMKDIGGLFESVKRRMFTPRAGEKKVWQSEVSEKLVCRKHQVLLCDVVLCECMTCISGLHQGVRCCFTIYTAITGWRGAPSTPASHRVFCRFFYFKFEAEHFLLHHKLWRGTSEKLKDRYSV